MSVRRMTSYRFLLLRSMLGRAGRAMAYYGVSTRAQVRMWRSSYALSMAGYRARRARVATFALLRRMPRKLIAGLSLIAWFFGELPKYFARILEERREDREELRAERRLMAAQRRAQADERRARRSAELAEIKASRHERPKALPVPAWISRLERPERPQRTSGARAIPVPRRAVLAAALTLAAAVPAYALVATSTDSGPPTLVADPNVAPGAAAEPAPGAVAVPAPGAVAEPAPAAPVGPAAPPVATPGAVAGLPGVPTPAPAVAPPAANPAAPGVVVGVDAVPVVGADGRKLSAHQQRELRRAAKAQAQYQHKADKAERRLADPGK